MAKNDDEMGKMQSLKHINLFLNFIRVIGYSQVLMLLKQ